MKFGSLVTIVGAPSLHLLQTNNRKQPVAQCKGGSRGSRMPTRIEKWLTGAGQVLNQVTGMLVPGSKRSSEQLEVADFTRRFRNGFNQMRDRLEAPAVKKPFRGSNPTGSNRRQLDRPFPFIIIGALIAVGLAVDLILIINAGGIPGVSIPGVTQTANAKVNKVASKVETVAKVVDGLAGDEEEYIVEDVDKDEEYIVEDVDEVDDYEDYEYDLPSLPVSDFTEDDLVDDEEQVVEIALDESLLAADEEEQAQPGAEDLAAVLAEDILTTEQESAVIEEDATTKEDESDVIEEEDATTTEVESDVGAFTSTAPETRSKFVEEEGGDVGGEEGGEVGGEDTRHKEDSEEKEVRFHKYDLDKEEKA